MKSTFCAIISDSARQGRLSGNYSVLMTHLKIKINPIKGHHTHSAILNTVNTLFFPFVSPQTLAGFNTHLVQTDPAALKSLVEPNSYHLAM